MEREEVLKQAQAQAGDLDEREQQMLGVSFGFCLLYTSDAADEL